MNNWLKSILGIYHLNDFEKDIFRTLENYLDGENLVVWRDQVGRFNRVERVLVDDERISHGSVSFYWMNGRKSRTDFPRQFKYELEEEKIAEFEVRGKNNSIHIVLWMVDGVFFTMHLFSENKIFQPVGKYEIVSTKIYI